MENLPDWVAILVALLAVGVSLFFSLRSDSAARAAARYAAEVQKRADAWKDLIDQHGALHEKSAEIIAWAARVLVVIAEMHELAKAAAAGAGGPPGDRKSALLGALSALVDEGRWHFPNYDHEVKGTSKAYAYRGIRQQVLDALVYTFDDFARLDPNNLSASAEASRRINTLRRIFVSEVQVYVNPKRLSIQDIRRLRFGEEIVDVAAVRDDLRQT